jgi:hypothetical protein
MIILIEKHCRENKIKEGIVAQHIIYQLVFFKVLSRRRHRKGRQTRVDRIPPSGKK